MPDHASKLIAVGGSKEDPTGCRVFGLLVCLQFICGTIYSCAVYVGWTGPVLHPITENL